MCLRNSGQPTATELAESEGTVEIKLAAAIEKQKRQVLTRRQSDAHFPSQRELLVVKIGERFVETLDMRSDFGGGHLRVKTLIQSLLFLVQVNVRFGQSLDDIFQSSLLRGREALRELLVSDAHVLESVIQGLTPARIGSDIFLAQLLQNRLHLRLRGFGTFDQGLKLRDLLAGRL
jgi:hypothetical protein